MGRVKTVYIRLPNSLCTYPDLIILEHIKCIERVGGDFDFLGRGALFRTMSTFRIEDLLRPTGSCPSHSLSHTGSFLVQVQTRVVGLIGKVPCVSAFKFPRILDFASSSPFTQRSHSH